MQTASHSLTLIPLRNSDYKLIIFGPRGTDTKTVAASLISNPHEGNPSALDSSCVYDGGGKKTKVAVSGAGCLICLQMCSDLISIPLHEPRRRSQRGSESGSVPVNVGRAPPRKVPRFTLWQKINLAGHAAKHSR